MRSSRDTPAGPRVTSSLLHEHDRLLAERVLGGDVDSLAALYTKHAPSVYTAALRLLGHSHDAEDVAQEVFARLSVTLTTWDPSLGELGPWLRRVSVRHALMRLRTARRRREVDTNDVAALLFRDESSLDRIDIDRALSRLSAEQRTVFVLKEVEGYSHRDIAELLGVSVATSEVRLYRARVALRAHLGSGR